MPTPADRFQVTKEEVGGDMMEMIFTFHETEDRLVKEAGEEIMTGSSVNDTACKISVAIGKALSDKGIPPTDKRSLKLKEEPNVFTDEADVEARVSRIVIAAVDNVLKAGSLKIV